MRVSDVMSGHVYSVDSTTGIAEVARKMGELDIGVIPVVDNGVLVGIVTDRDIAVRGLAEGLHPGSPVMRVMTDQVKTCEENDDLDDVLEEMGDEQVRRMPVCSASGELIGIISIGDLAQHDPDKDEVAEALCEICCPAGIHSQQAQTF